MNEFIDSTITLWHIVINTSIIQQQTVITMKRIENTIMSQLNAVLLSI